MIGPNGAGKTTLFNLITGMIAGSTLAGSSSDVDRRLFGDVGPAPAREEIVARMTAYLHREASRGTAPRHVVRHMLGLYQGARGRGSGSVSPAMPRPSSAKAPTC